MKNTPIQKSAQKSSHKMVIGVGIAALAAAAAGAYYLYGSDKSAKNRKQIKSWMLKMKAEVMDKIENVKDLSKDTYDKTIDEVSKKYSQIKNVDKKELVQLAKRMKSHWKEIEADVQGTVGKEVKRVTK